jgi:hypothetical protein
VNGISIWMYALAGVIVGVGLLLLRVTKPIHKDLSLLSPSGDWITAKNATTTGEKAELVASGVLTGFVMLALTPFHFGGLIAGATVFRKWKAYWFEEDHDKGKQ